MVKAFQWLCGATVAGLIVLAPFGAPAQERVGTSQEDLPNYSGSYSIENATGITIHYQYRWGDKSEWKRMALRAGEIETHSYPLGQDRNKRVPAPYVRYDRIGGDNSVTFQEYKMQFYAVGYAGFGPRQNRTEPKRYVFRFAENGRDLRLLAKR
jgi:hypothetical protein